MFRVVALVYRAGILRKGNILIFRLKEINKSKRRPLGCRLRLNKQERTQK